MIVCGIEREEPDYPGLKLEQPILYPTDDSTEESQFYRINPMYTRISGKLYYVFLVDTCALIYDKSFQNFESFVEENLIIE